VHVAFTELHVGRYRKIPRQTEGHSIGGISYTVSVVPSSVRELCTVLCSCLYGSCEIQFRTKSLHL
jgi:hypothetical protein